MQSLRPRINVHSVIPAVKDKKPVFEVLVATPAGKSVPLTINGE